MKLLLDGEHVLVVDLSLVGDERTDDIQPLLKDVHTGQPGLGPTVSVELDGAFFEEHSGSFRLHMLSDEYFEYAMDELAEEKRHTGLGGLFFNVVELEAGRALLEPCQPAVAKVFVDESFLVHLLFSF